MRHAPFDRLVPPQPTSVITPRIVQCHTCKGDSVYSPDNPYRPFCSERCKSVDFGGWASESYRLKATPPARDDGSDWDDADLPPAN